MLKNQNGYPAVDRTAYGRVAVIRCNSVGGENSGNRDMTYAEGCAALDGAPLAYVYSPDQRFRLLYSAKDALAHGTLFEELYKPMEVYGNE